MKSRTSVVSAAFAVLISHAQAAGPEATRVGGYDFSYVTSGDHRATPVQVFDDGRSTYFQFRTGDVVPAIFSHRTGSPELMVPTQDGPYIKVTSVSGRFLLQAGRSQAQVIHSGGTRPDAPTLVAVSGNGTQAAYRGERASTTRVMASVQPATVKDDAIHHNSYATPRKGDRVIWTEGEPRRDETQVWFARGTAVLSTDARRAIAAIARVPAAARLIVIGRDDDTYKEGLDKQRAQVLREALVKAGIPEDRITMRTGIASKGRGNQWASDVIIEMERPEVAVRNAPAGQDVIGNLEALVRSGVLRQDQAEAIAANRGVNLPRMPGSVQAGPSAMPAVAAIPPGGFTLSTADKTIQGAIRRWASALSYQLVWDAPALLDAAIVGDATVTAGSIDEALKRLLVGLGEKGYALDATVYANRVIRLTPAGIPSTVPATATPAAPAPAPRTVPSPADRRAPEKRVPAIASDQQWQMRQGDGNVQRMFTRWAQQGRWTVVWHAREQIPIIGDAVVSGSSFKSAAEKVIAGAAAAGYHLKLAEREDRTLVVSNY